MLLHIVRETREGTLDEGPFEEEAAKDYYDRLVEWIRYKRDHDTMSIMLITHDRTQVLQSRSFPYTPYYVPSESELKRIRAGKDPTPKPKMWTIKE